MTAYTIITLTLFLGIVLLAVIILKQSLSTDMDDNATIDSEDTNGVNSETNPLAELNPSTGYPMAIPGIGPGGYDIAGNPYGSWRED